MEDDYTSIFDKETTISMSAGNIEKILILQVRENTHLKVEQWLVAVEGTSDYYRASRRAEASLKVLLAKLKRAMEKKSPQRLEAVEEMITDGEYYDALLLINEYLLEIGLTSFYQKKIDTSNVEEENQAKGL